MGRRKRAVAAQQSAVTASTNRENLVLKVIASVVLLALGIALTVFSGGLLALAIPGKLLIAGGATMLMLLLTSKGNASWSELGKVFLKGTVIALVSFGFSALAHAMFANFEMCLICKGAVTVASTIAGSLVTNTISNLLNGKRGMAAVREGWIRALLLGAVIGGASAISSTLATCSSEAFHACISNENADILLQGLEKFKELKDTYESLIRELGPWLEIVVEGGCSFTIELVLNTANQMVSTDGVISFATVFYPAIMAGVMGACRAGLNAMSRSNLPVDVQSGTKTPGQEGGAAPAPITSHHSHRLSAPIGDSQAAVAETELIASYVKNKKPDSPQNPSKRGSTSDDDADDRKDDVQKNDTSSSSDDDAEDGHDEPRRRASIDEEPEEPQSMDHEDASADPEPVNDPPEEEAGKDDPVDPENESTNDHPEADTGQDYSAGPDIEPGYAASDEEAGKEDPARRDSVGRVEAPAQISYGGYDDGDDRPSGSRSTSRANQANSVRELIGAHAGVEGLEDVETEARMITTISEEIRYDRRIRRQLAKEEAERIKAEQDANRSAISYNPDAEPVNVYAGSGRTASREECGVSGSQSTKGGENRARQEDGHLFDEKKVEITENNEVPSFSGATLKRSHPRPRKIKERANLLSPSIEWIVFHSEEHKKYCIRTEPWPTIRNKSYKVIAMAGLKGSGRTTLLHALLYEYGYVLTEDQALATRIGFGIMMYVLERPGIIILDIADSMDSTGDAFPLGSSLLEIFGYLNCDQLIYNMPIMSKNTDVTDEFLISWIEKRLQFLFGTGILLMLPSVPKISVVLRPGNPDEQGDERVEAVIAGFEQKMFEYNERIAARVQAARAQKGESSNGKLDEESQMMTEQELATLIQAVKDRKDEPSEDKPNELRQMTSQELARVMHTISAYRLPYLEPDAIGSLKPYRRALKQILSELRQSDRGYRVVVPDEQIEETLIRVWDAIINSEQLQKMFAEAATKSGAAREENDREAMNLNDAMQKFHEKAVKLRKDLGGVAECASLLDELNKLNAEVTEKIKREQDLKDEEKDPFIYHHFTLSTASKIISAARGWTSISNKERGLRVGLEGITCMFGRGRDPTIMDSFAVRFCLQDFAIMPHLIDPAVYRNYSDCWKFLWHAAGCGFKIMLAEFPIIEAAKLVLPVSSDELRYEPALIHKYASEFVVTMLEEKVDLSWLSRGEQSSMTDGRVIPDERMKRLTMRLREANRRSTRETLERMRSGTISDGTERLLNHPKEWFNQRMAPDFHFNYDDLNSRHKNDFMQVAFEVASKEIAFATASELVNCLPDWFTITDKTPTELSKNLLRVLAECVEHAAADDEIFLNLCETSVRKLIDLRKTSDNDDVNKHIERALIFLIGAEHKRKLVKGGTIEKRMLELDPKIKEWSQRKVHDMDELKRRGRREERLRRHGHVRLACMESGLGMIALERLLQHDTGSPIEFKHQMTLLRFLDAFVVSESEDEDKYEYVNPIMQQRGSIIRVVSQLIIGAAEQLRDVNADTTTFVLSPLFVIDAACTLFNELLHKFLWHDLVDFYDREKIEMVVRGFVKFADIADTPSFKLINDALCAVYHSVLARPAMLSKTEGGKHADVVQRAIVKVISAYLNASSTSGISFPTVLSEMAKEKSGKPFVATLKETKEPENPDVLLRYTDMAKLTPNKDDFQGMNILRAAYLVHLSDGTSLTDARTVMLSVLNETIADCIRMVEQEDQDKQELQRIKLEESQLEKQQEPEQPTETRAEVRIAALDLNANSIDARATEPEVELAVNGIYHEVYHGGATIVFRKGEAIDLSECEATFGVGGACAVRLLMHSENDKQMIRHLRSHLEICQKKDTNDLIRMRMGNSIVRAMLNLDGARETLFATGHGQIEQNDELVWIFDKEFMHDGHLRALEEFIHCYDYWTRTAFIRLHSHFEPCDIMTTAGRGALLCQRLPPDFFGKNDTILSELPISTLLARRIRDRSVKSDYVLVRIQLREGRLVQTIFNTAATQESILAELRKHDPLVHSVNWNPSSSTTTMTNSDPVSKISNFAVYGVAQY